MSDHKIVITDINIKVKSKKSVPGKIYIYNNRKANMNVINQHVDKENKLSVLFHISLFSLSLCIAKTTGVFLSPASPTSNNWDI
jgi:hypothetical protein